MLRSVELLAHESLRLWPCFAGLNALVPRVVQVGITSTPAVIIPSTAKSATTTFAGFPHGAAFGTYRLRRGT